MISFKKIDNNLIATYTTRNDNIDWLYEKLDNDESYSFQKTFIFSKNDVWGNLREDADKTNPFDEPEVNFVFAELKDNYFLVRKGVLINKVDVYISQSIKVTTELFVVESDISIFKKLEELISEDIYIGGENVNAIPEEEFIDMINRFPSAYEKKLYADARVTSIIKEFFASSKDYEKRFQNYLNKKSSFVGDNLIKTFKDAEVIKYETVYDKLDEMLNNENNYSEKQWQKEILQIILLLYPKYICVFDEVRVNADDIKEKYLDFLLVDSNGNVDIIEIKKPFENSIMTSRLYRDNYIPLRELSGTVMQIEKYIYFLNRWSIKGEKYLTQKYKNQLPQDFEIKITNPSAFIIMGRDKNLNYAQKKDFEVVKRKYRNVVDVITYDNLLERLKFTIEQIKKM